MLISGNNQEAQNSNGNNSNVYSIKQHEAIISGEYTGHIISVPEDIVMVKRGIFNGQYRKITSVRRRTLLDYMRQFGGTPLPPRVRIDRKGIIWVVFSRIVENHEMFGVKKGKAIYLISKKTFVNDLDNFTNISTVDKNMQTVNVDFSYKWRVVDPVKYIKCNAPEGEVLSYIQAFIDAYMKRMAYKELTGGDLNHDKIRLNVRDDYVIENVTTNGGVKRQMRKPNIVKQILDDTKHEFGIEITSLEFQKILPDKRIIEEINKTKVVEEQVKQRKIQNDRDIEDIKAFKEQGFTNDQITKMRALNTDKANVGVIIGDGSSNLSAQIGAGIYATQQKPINGYDDSGQKRR